MDIILRAEENFKVTQANALIEAEYKKFLPMRAQKVVRLIFSLISPDDGDLRIYKVKLDDMKRYLGYREGVTWGRFRQDLREIVYTLYQNKDVLYIRSKNRELFAPLFASIEFNDDDDTIEFEISSKLKPYLIKLKKNFTSYGLANIHKLRSSYSIRLYELLKQYYRIGYREFTIEDLRKKLGIDEGKYEKYSQFKLRAILKPQEDLKEYTDLSFSFTEIKQGRKIVALYFQILPNQPAKVYNQELQQLELFSPQETQLPEEDSKILEMLHSLGVKPDQAIDMYRQGFDIIKAAKSRAQAQEHYQNVDHYFLDKINLVRTKGDTLDNPVGFLLEALRNDWTTKRVEDQKKLNAKKKNEHLQVELDKLQKNRRYEIDGICQELLDEYPELLQQAYTAATEEYRDTLNYVFKPGRSLIDLYDEGGFATMAINNQIEKLKPNRFQAVYDLYDQQIQEVKKTLSN